MKLITGNLLRLALGHRDVPHRVFGLGLPMELRVRLHGRPTMPTLPGTVPFHVWINQGES